MAAFAAPLVPGIGSYTGAIKPVPPVTAKPPPTVGSTGEALTLDALMARQKEIAGRQGDVMGMPVTNIPQGLGQMAWSLVNALQGRAAEKEMAQANQDVANAVGAINWETGEMPPQALETLMARDPDLGLKLRLTMYQEAMETRRQKEKAAAEGGPKLSDLGSLRDDYSKAATVYENAAPTWQSMQKSIKIALDPKIDAKGKGAADYALVVGLAKILDPTSVVREGEVESVRATGGAADYLVSYFNQLTSGGSLSDDVRQGIMQTGQDRMRAYYDQTKAKHDWITGIATRHGMNPDDIVPPLPAFAPYEQAANADPNALPARPAWATAQDPWPNAKQWEKLTPEEKAIFIKWSTSAERPGDFQ